MSTDSITHGLTDPRVAGITDLIVRILNLSDDFENWFDNWADDLQLDRDELIDDLNYGRD